MRKKGGRRKAEGGNAILRSCQRARPASFPLPPSPFRLGVTLIELLIVISIIATLSAIFMGATRSAMEAASAARTKSTINKLNGLLMEKWASYSTRRAEIKPSIINDIENSFSNPRARSEALADARLLATRELMKLEMPDRWSDIIIGNVPSTNPENARSFDPAILDNRPGLSTTYLRRFYQIAKIKNDGKLLLNNQGAECLYMVIMLSTGDGEARSSFSPQDIGDVDEDGAPEFLDGWGNPIGFARWPAGFAPTSAVMSGDADTDHDPFDPFRRDLPTTITPPVRRYPPSLRGYVDEIRSRNSQSVPISAYRLMPLIFSYGADGDSDITVTTGTTTELDPYSNNYSGMLLGTAVDTDTPLDGEGWHDNIHNHLLGN